MSEQLASQLPAWRRYLAYATVALMPLSTNIEKYIKQEKPQPDYKGPLDLLLPVLALLFIGDWLLKRDRIRFKFPPIPMVLWTLLAAASCFAIDKFPGEGTLMPALKAVANVALFGLAGVWVFQNVGNGPGDYRRMSLILGASFSVCLLIALKQYFGPLGIPFDPENPAKDLGGATNMRVAGWYDFRAAFGSHVALLVPAAAAFAFCDENKLVRWAAGIFAIVALCVTLAAGGFIGACAGLIAVVCAYGLSGRWLTALLGLAILIGVASVVLPRLPRKNSDVLLRNISLYTEVDDNGNRKPTARLRRYQAAIDLLGAPSSRAENAPPFWLRGTGIGRYQSQINRFYTPARPVVRTDEEAAFDSDADERFTFGFLETTAVEMGVTGILVIAMIFGVWIFAGHAAFARMRGAPDAIATLGLAAFGAGVGALVLSAFASPMIPGVKGSLAFFMALALCADAWSKDAAQFLYARRTNRDDE
jgi:hypothetical protein